MVQIFDNMASGASMGSGVRDRGCGQFEPMRVQQLRFLGLLADVASGVQPMARQVPLRPLGRKHYFGVGCGDRCFRGFLARSYAEYCDLGLCLSRLHLAGDPH